ncbi:hypothetical protein F5B18DRAFT_585383 [Nemania serpens]|nr:hypothetical protein F5B18DRAFT_585383 [Nemania serpens]
MGQSTSQPQEEEGHDPKHVDPLDQDEDQNRHPTSDNASDDTGDNAGDDVLFSSQVYSSVVPALPPLRRPTKIKYSSSRRHSSQAPTPIARRKMSGSSLFQSSPAFVSSMNPGVQANEDGILPRQLKKKKRNKKRHSSSSAADKDQLSSVPDSLSALYHDLPAHANEQQHHSVMDGADSYDNNDDVNINNTPASPPAQRRHKKEKKHAARLARQQQQLAARSVSEAIEEPSAFAEIWESQEQAIAAKREHIEEDEPAESQNATSKKKRKRNSHNQAEDALKQGSKKRKNSHSTTGSMAAEHDELAPSNAVAGHEASYADGDISFNDLAEQLYSDRKRNSHFSAIAADSASASEVGFEHENPSGVMGMDGQIQEDLTGSGSVKHEAAGGAEVYHNGHIDNAYNDDHHGNITLQAPPAGHITTTRSPSGSPKELIHDIHNSQFGITGIEQNGVANYGVQIEPSMNTGVVPSHNVGAVYDFVEIPSSVPHPTGAGEHSAKPRATNKASTGRKRVAKPDFFSRIVDEIDESLALQSPSTAPLSRRAQKGKGKEMAVAEGDVQAGPSTANGKVKQPKITSMLDGNIAATPSRQSAVRLRTPKTPATLSGAFSDFEIRNLTQAIERFRDDNGMTQFQVNELLHINPKEARAGDLWEHIVATCPGRSRQKVINQTRRRFHNFVARGTWTIEQEAELNQMYKQYGNKFALIGQLINRHPEDIRDRIRNYTICGNSLKRDQWTQGEVDKLIIIIKEASVEILKERAKRNVNDDRPVEDDINWQLVSQGMGRTRSRIQCIAKWKSVKPQLNGGGLDGETAPIEEIIQQARETATTMSYRNRSLVIKEILKTSANADSRIPWLKIRNELGNQWTRPPLMIVWFRLKRTIANWQSLNVKEISTLLLQHFQQTHKLEYPTEESGDLDYDVEYREVEYRIRRGRNGNLTPKSAAFISKASDDEDEDEEEEEGEEGEEQGEGEAEGRVRDLLDATGEEAVETAEAETSHSHRRHSVDLGIGSASEKERVVEDSEPETDARSRRRRRQTRSQKGRSKPQDIQQDESEDGQSSDTNASQVSSIPAR